MSFQLDICVVVSDSLLCLAIENALSILHSNPVLRDSYFVFLTLADPFLLLLLPFTFALLPLFLPPLTRPTTEIIINRNQDQLRACVTN